MNPEQAANDYSDQNEIDEARHDVYIAAHDKRVNELPTYLTIAAAYQVGADELCGDDFTDYINQLGEDKHLELLHDVLRTGNVSTVLTRLTGDFIEHEASLAGKRAEAEYE